ncbi:unnamed protein product [Litomosoides sigmodontis]|uniref:V-SNARE coiled-coil homology domain-containing protein n=1 Tax=Litomosoides sigmodontis TaxID=42156 RepID=A0A3P6UFN8_LITSI|nr:unnamed protein product [Litomosoides sigmodontis]
MDYWNGAMETGRIATIRQQVENIREVMNNNMQRVLDRGDQLDNIASRTEALTQSSENFQWTAQRIQRRACVKNAKWTIILTVCLIVVAAIVMLIILKKNCGVFGHS